ncbi:MAG: hypothetical protein JWN71_1256, partial [Xanthobacteraceae bacterium]|nr:hypothetical protein [Xanthobacteraceae bacterium]
MPNAPHETTRANVVIIGSGPAG